jgi:hypothetical protein
MIGDGLLDETFAYVEGCAVVFDNEFDLLAGYRVAVLGNVKACARDNLLAGARKCAVNGMTIPILTVVCAAAPPNIAAAIPRDITIRLMTLIHIATSRRLVGIGLNLERARSRRAIESVSRLQCVAFAVCRVCM